MRARVEESLYPQLRRAVKGILTITQDDFDLRLREARRPGNQFPNTHSSLTRKFATEHSVIAIALATR
jgi:hypothetical protein